MSLRRLRSGERLALSGAVGLAVLLALNWFLLSTPDARVGQHESGVRALGWLATLIMLAAILAGLATALTSLTRRAAAVPVVAAVLATFLGFFAAVAIVVRLVAQPGLGVDAGDGDVDVLLPAYLGLVCAAAITVGGWLSMADERTDTDDARRQTEDVLRVRGAPRPAPPRTASPS